MPENSLRKEKEQAWATALQGGSLETLAMLYDAYAPILLGLISRIIPIPEAAEEVLLETFVAIWHRKETYDAAQTGLLTWMILLTREKALEVLKNARRNAFSGNKELRSFVVPENPAEPINKLALPDFQSNSKAEKATLELIYLQGYSCEEAAAALNIPEGDLRNSLVKAIKQLGAEKAS